MPVISPQGLESKSCYTCVNGPTVNMAERLVLSFNSSSGDVYSVSVCPGNMYKITYYDSSIQNVRTVTGKVTGISTETIAMEVITVLDEAGNICLCNNRTMLAGYLSAEYFYIPVQNISSIQEINPYDTGSSTKPTERSEQFVAILGISSQVIRAVIVRLTIFEDNVQHTATPVDMEVGRSYHVVYAKENTVYELDGRLIRIEEVPLNGSESLECGYVRPDNQVVGQNGNIYDSRYFYNLPPYNPDGDRIKFVFDTSKDFVGMYDSVMLKDIRDVKLTGGNPMPPPPPPHPYPPMPPYPWPPAPQPPCPPYWPPYGPCDDPNRPGPCDPVPPVGPGDVPPPGNGTGGGRYRTTDSTGTPNWMYNPTTTSTGNPVQNPNEITYTSLNNPEDVIGDFNKP